MTHLDLIRQAHEAIDATLERADHHVDHASGDLLGVSVDPFALDRLDEVRALLADALRRDDQ